MPKKKGSSSLKWRQIPKDKTFFPLFIDGTKKCKNTPKIIDAKLIRETISCPEYKVEFEKSLRAREKNCNIKDSQLLNKKHVHIAVPKVEKCENFIPVSKKYKHPDHYIKYRGRPQVHILHYDLLEEDVEWLKQNSVSKPGFPALNISEITLSKMIYLFEEHAFTAGSISADPTSKYNTRDAINDAGLYFNVNSYVANMVFRFWVAKRKKLGKALMRKFQPLTQDSDSSAKVPFRSRCQESKMTTRKSFKEYGGDHIRYHQKIRELSKQFVGSKRKMKDELKSQRIKRTKLNNLDSVIYKLKNKIISSQFGENLKIKVAEGRANKIEIQAHSALMERLVYKNPHATFFDSIYNSKRNSIQKRNESDRQESQLKRTISSHLSKNKKPGPSLWKIPWDDGEDDSESSEPESDEELELVARLHSICDKTRKERIQEIMGVDIGVNYNFNIPKGYFDMKPSRLGRIAFNFSTLEEDLPSFCPSPTWIENEESSTLFGLEDKNFGLNLKIPSENEQDFREKKEEEEEEQRPTNILRQGQSVHPLQCNNSVPQQPPPQVSLPPPVLKSTNNNMKILKENNNKQQTTNLTKNNLSTSSNNKKKVTSFVLKNSSQNFPLVNNSGNQTHHLTSSFNKTQGTIIPNQTLPPQTLPPSTLLPPRVFPNHHHQQQFLKLKANKTSSHARIILPQQNSKPFPGAPSIPPYHRPKTSLQPPLKQTNPRDKRQSLSHRNHHTLKLKEKKTNKPKLPHSFTYNGLNGSYVSRKQN